MDEPQVTVTIKKYANRRMYDSANSRYVNLTDIGALIKEGAVVEVVDASTGEDLTKVILTQIILEEEKNQRNLLPVSFLHDIIKSGESAYGDYVRQFLSSSFEMYQRTQDQLRSTLQSWAPGWPGFGGAPGTSKGSDVEDLRRRLAQLEARLGQGSEEKS